MPVLSSLVITVYNRERYLGAAIESVLAQTRGNFELLVWDDGSTDSSVQIAQDYARQDVRVRVVAAQHQGRGRALKDAIAQTTGTYIGIVDSDDILAPTALEETAAILDAHPATGLVYTDYLVMNESGQVTSYGSRCRFPYSPMELLRKFMTFHFRVIRRTVFEQVGGINESFYLSEDYELCLRLSEVTQVQRVSKPLYYYRVHRESITQQRKAEQNRLCLKAVKQALKRRQRADNFPVTLLSCTQFSTEPSQNLPVAPLFKASSTSSINRVNPPGIQIPGSQLKSSKDDSIRNLVHFHGLDLLARSLNSGRISGKRISPGLFQGRVWENLKPWQSSKLAQDCVSSIAKRFTQSLAKTLNPFLAALPLLGAISVTPALAQIVPAADGTNTLVNTTGNQLDITGGQTSSNGTNLFHSFSQFDLNAGQTANFQSNPTIQNILGRVVGGNASNINGLIQVSGSQANLYLMNPAGIIFGSNASLNVPADFVATTATSIGIGNNWFNAAGTNDYTQLNGAPNAFAFTTSQPGSIVNSGNLTVGAQKNLLLLGGTVVSTGQLNAQAGKIIVAAVPGERMVRLSQPGMVLSLEVPLPASNSNQPAQWTVPVLSLPQLLTGGGGENATGIAVNANGQVALTGSGVLVPTDPGTTIIAGTVNASSSAPNQKGGEVNILGDKVGLVSANIDASGTNGGGAVLIGGDYQGKGEVRNASRTYVSNDSTIHADALTQGDGGKVILWADEVTGFHGNISAHGGSNFGNGGFVEVSGKQDLIFDGQVNLSAPNGSIGTLLLDPTDITISYAPSSAGVDAQLNGTAQILQDNFSPTPGSIFISQATLEGLPNTATVVLEASNNITIDTLTGNQLTFAPLAGGGSITFRADADNSGVGSFLMGANQSINALGRNITISGASITAGTITTNAPSLAAPNGGAINLNAPGNITATRLSSGTLGAGIGGKITVTSTNGTINITGAVDSGSAGAGLGSGGDIALTARGNITTADVLARSNSDGTGGRIDIISTQGNIDTTASIYGVESFGATGGSITLNARGDIKARGIRTDAFGTTGDAGTITLTSSDGSIDTSGKAINSSSTGGKAGAIALSAPNSITTGNINSRGLAGTGNISFTSDEINFAPRAFVRGSGTLSLQPFTPSQAIAIGGATDSGVGTLDLLDTDLAAIRTDFTSLIIGRSDGTGAITLNPVTFYVPTIIQTSTDSGSITTTPGVISTNYGKNLNLTLISNQINTSASTIDTSTDYYGAGDINITAPGGITLGNLIATGSSYSYYPSPPVSLPGGNITLTGPVTLASSDTSITTGDSNGSGAGNIKFSSTINGTTSGTQALNLTVGAGTVTFDGAVGGVKPLGSLNITGGNGSQVFVKSDITIANNNLTFDQPVTLTGNATFKAETGTIGFNSSLATGNNALTLTANEIDFAGGANSVTGTGNLTLQPFTPTQNIAIAGAGDSGTGTLDITTTDLAALQNGFSSITIGGADTSSTITLANPVTFNDPVTIQAPDGAGTISATGAITGLDNASITLKANQNITTSNITANPGITIISSNGKIDTSAGILDSSSTTSNGGAIALSALGDITTNNITSHSDTSAGGDITLNSQTGVVSSGNLDASGNTRGGNITVIARNQITAGQINSSAIIGDGGNVTLDPIGDIQVDFINAQGGTSGKGGTVDITTNQFFRALSSFTDQNGINASLSTAGGTGGGGIVIRHDGGARGIPFDVGNASTNGTTGAITTGLSNSILPLQSFPGSYSQGNIQLITQNPPPPPPSTPSPSPQPNTNSISKDIQGVTFATTGISTINKTARILLNTTSILREDIEQALADGQIEKAIALLEQMRMQEFQNYFEGNLTADTTESATLEQTQAVLTSIAENTGKTPAVIYVFTQPDQLQLILVTPKDKPILKTVYDTNHDALLKMVSQFRSEVTEPRKKTGYQASAKQLYQWLVAPLESELQAKKIDTLVFSMDAGLRSLPLAALYDGKQFLVEKYSIGLIPSINLTDTHYGDVKTTEVLAMGASKFTEQNPLPSVPVELSTIVGQQNVSTENRELLPANQSEILSQGFWSGESFLNQGFTLNNLKAQRNRTPFGVIHLATHGEFNLGAPRNSYIQLWNTKLRLDQLRQMGWNNPPVELLVLSACRTALGNEDAEFGFGGLAVAAGVKSALASLWYVSDEGTLALITEFYERLKTAPIKAEALREAQIAMIKGQVRIEGGKLRGIEQGEESIPLPPELANSGDKDLSHPYYWSAFTMIGSPW